MGPNRCKTPAVAKLAHFLLDLSDEGRRNSFWPTAVAGEDPSALDDQGMVGDGAVNPRWR